VTVAPAEVEVVVRIVNVDLDRIADLMTLASIVFWSQVVTRMLASEVSIRRSGLPLRL
jgi:hypothetical protein